MPALVNARFLVPVFYALPLSRFRPTDPRRSSQGCAGQGAGRYRVRLGGSTSPREAVTPVTNQATTTPATDRRSATSSDTRIRLTCSNQTWCDAARRHRDAW